MIESSVDQWAFTTEYLILHYHPGVEVGLFRTFDTIDFRSKQINSR